MEKSKRIIRGYWIKGGVSRWHTSRLRPSRMLKKSASCVSQFRSDPQRTQRVRLGPSLAAPCWTDFLSIPRECSPVLPHLPTVEILSHKNIFPRSVLAMLRTSPPALDTCDLFPLGPGAHNGFRIDLHKQECSSCHTCDDSSPVFSSLFSSA